MSASANISCEAGKPLISAGARKEDGFLFAKMEYTTTSVQCTPERVISIPEKREIEFKTDLTPRRTGLLFVGLAGNNGTSLTAGLIANRMNLSWETRRGTVQANWYGSIAVTGTCKIGVNSATSTDVYMPISKILPMVVPDDLVIGGWDINGMQLDEALKRAGVLPIELQRQIYGEMQKIRVLPGIYDKDFIATNQEVRADNVMAAKTKKDQVAQLRNDIRLFKKSNDLENVIVLWNGNTERFSEHVCGTHDTAENLLNAIERNESELAPSLLYCVASVLENCAYINGSPQNTFCDGLLALAAERGVYLAGDDLKTGQTKFKSVLTDFMVSTALKPTAIVSYNHLGNNDGLNLSSEKQFRSKEITKASVVDDMIASNTMLYPDGEHPDHLIVIKYVPTVGDSKRALDEYTSRIFMNGDQTIVVHNTCEDSLLAAPIILDLVLFMELLQRISVKSGGGDFQQLDTLQSLLSLFLKAPRVPKHAPVVNALFPQREALIDFLKSAAGIPPSDYMALGYRLAFPTV